MTPASTASEVQRRMRLAMRVPDPGEAPSEPITSVTPAPPAPTKAARRKSSIRLTFDLPADQHRWLARYAIDARDPVGRPVRQAEIIRCLLTLLEDDAGLRDEVVRRLGAAGD